MDSTSYFGEKRCDCSKIRRNVSMVSGTAGFVLGTVVGFAIDGFLGGAVGALTLTPIGVASGWYNHSLLALCK